MKIITIASDPNFPGHLQLKRSLDHFGHDYHVMIESFQFGRQMKTIYQWCKANWGWFLYTDAYDTFALSHPQELERKLPNCKMLISTEKACYPHPEWASRYPKCESEWKYVNGGGFLTTCEYFVQLYEDGSHHEESNDQAWLTEQFLKRQDEIKLDYNCDIFQTIAFCGLPDFDYVHVKCHSSLRVVNCKTESVPIFIHGNGHTDMTLIYKLLP